MVDDKSVKQPLGKLILETLKLLGLQIWDSYVLVWCGLALCCITLYIFHVLLLCLISLTKQ